MEHSTKILRMVLSLDGRCLSMLVKHLQSVVILREGYAFGPEIAHGSLEGPHNREVSHDLCAGA
jgi:hypothetical protein